MKHSIGDQRRLMLGDVDQYDTRQLIQAIHPFLTEEQRIKKLETQILSFAPIHKQWGIRALQLRGLEQLYLLQSIPIGSLTLLGRCRLHEWERKFPGVRASDDPKTIHGGVVGPPIPDDRVRRMSDSAWLRAFQKYQKGTHHKDFLKGGAYELSRILKILVKEAHVFLSASFKSVNDMTNHMSTHSLTGWQSPTCPLNGFSTVCEDLRVSC